MSDDLIALLEAAAPEPRRLLNPDELLRKARRRVTLRRRAGAGLGAAVLGGAATTALLVPSGHQSPGANGGTDTPVVSALATTRPLPAAVTRALAQSPFISTGRGSLVRQIGREQVYLAPANNGELLCIVDFDATGHSMTCAPRSALLSTGVYLATKPNDTSPAQALLIVPDGYTTATSGTTTAAVAANLAVLQPVTDGTVTLSGGHRPSVTLHWGPFGFPPAPAKAGRAASTSGRVPLVTSGPCAGLTVLAYIPTGAAAPPDAWRISPGAAGNRITVQGNSSLYLRASGPCTSQLRYLPHTAEIQGPTGTDASFAFVDGIGFVVAQSTAVTRTATVDLLLGCTSHGCGANATTVATVALTVMPRATSAPATAVPAASAPTTAGTARSSGITDDVARKLRTLALYVAAQQGDPSPSLVTAVYAPPTSTQNATFVIAMKGRFSCPLCRQREPLSSLPVPLATDNAPSTVAELVLDAHSYATVSGSVGDIWPDLAVYGTARNLTRPIP